MSDILIIQNAKNEGIAALGSLFEEDGFKITKINAKNERIPDLNPRAIIILGAPESANDSLSHLREEMRLIQESVANQVPVLGICLGSQLIAKSFGAPVYRGNNKEIGFYHDVEFDNISDFKLFDGVENPATVFHWHGDTFDLPKNAIRLAHSKNYKNQAIKIGSAVGIQFHLEVDEQTVRSWLEMYKDELHSVPHIRSEAILNSMPKSLEKISDIRRVFYKNFKSAFSL